MSKSPRPRARLAAWTPALAAVAVGVLSVLGAPPARAAGPGPQKTFKEHNFQLTLPTSDWTFEEVLEENQAAGFVAVARRSVSPGVEVMAKVRVVPSGASELASLMTQLREKTVENLTDLVKDEVAPGTWAGVKSSLVTLKGKYANGSIALFRIYGAVVDGKFHELSVRIMNRAEDAIEKELDNLADGYRFLKGGTPPRPETGTPPAGMDDSGGTPPAGMDGGDAPAPGAGEPAGEGATKKFAALGLSWTLPKPGGEGKPQWEWATDGNPTLGRSGNGLVAVMVLVLPDGGKPISTELYVQPAKPGVTPELIANDTHLANDLTEKNFSGSPAPKIDEEVKVGNASGAALAITGKNKGDPPVALQVREYFVILQKVVFQVAVVSREGAEKTLKGEIRASLDGLAWENPKQGLRGPIASPIHMDMDARGDYLDKEIDSKATKAHGFTLTKPVGFAFLKVDGADPATQYNDHQVLWFAAEERKEGLYCFFSITSYPAKDFLDQKPAKDPESLIDEVEGAWKNAVTDPVTRPKSDKTNRAPGAFGTAHGSTYEFRGTLRGTPYLERGWVVKNGQTWFHIREQFGGKDAETALAGDLKAMTKTVKFE